jgi:hypothetical protein
MGIFRKAVLPVGSPVELCKRAHHTESACCRTTVGGKLNELLATRGTSNIYVISLLIHVLALPTKSEGLQKCLAQCDMDMHRIAHTMDACIPGQTSQVKGKYYVKWGMKSTKHGSNLGLHCEHGLLSRFICSLQVRGPAQKVDLAVLTCPKTALPL